MTFRRSAPRYPTRHASGRGSLELRGRFATVAAAGLLIAAEALAAAPVAAHDPPAAATPVPGAPAAQAAQAGDTAAGVGALQPGVQYQELMAHAADRIDFAPGGRVTVPYRPRAGDTWSVGGRAPRALPAGTATGRALIPSSAGAATPAPATVPQPAPASAAPAPSDAPVDAPSNDTSPPPAADDASARLPAATGDAGLDATHLRRQVFGFLPYWEVNDAVLDYNAALDDRLLRRRRRQERQPPEARLRRLDDDRLERLDELEDDLDHQRRPRQGHARRADGQRVRWIDRPGPAPERAARQPHRPAQPRPPDRGGRPRPRRRRRQPRLRADRDRLRRRVHGARPDGPDRAQQAGARLPADVRHDRLRSATTRSRPRPLRAAPTRSSSWATTTAARARRTSARSLRSSGPATTSRHDRRLRCEVSPSKLILGVPYYGRAWSTVSDAVNAKNRAARSTAPRPRSSYDTALDYAKQYGRRWDPRERVGVDRLPAAELHRDLRLRHLLAPDLLRRRDPR